MANRCAYKDGKETSTPYISTEGVGAYIKVVEEVEKFGGFKYRDMGGEGKVAIMTSEALGKDEEVRDVMDGWIWGEGDRELRLRVLAFYTGKGNEWIVNKQLYTKVMQIVGKDLTDREEILCRKICKKFTEKFRENVFKAAGVSAVKTTKKGTPSKKGK